MLLIIALVLFSIIIFTLISFYCYSSFCNIQNQNESPEQSELCLENN
jgi:hypothetical protein